MSDTARSKQVSVVMPVFTAAARYFQPPRRIYWWRHRDSRKRNFGDEITGFLIRRLLGCRTEWSSPTQCEMAGAGSIIEILHEKSEGNRVQVWGSGFIRDGHGLGPTNLVFHAVRGKLSRERIGSPATALGDPALLLPLVVNPRSRRKKYQLGIIPHYVDETSEKLQRFRGCAQVKIISVFAPIPRIVDAISACQMIVSSSLHGLIVSDAYGVPNSWIRLSGDLVGGDYKFRDYYSLYDQSPKPRELADFDLGDWQSWSQEYRDVQPMVRKIQAELLRVLPGLPASHAFFAGAGSLPGTR